MKYINIINILKSKKIIIPSSLLLINIVKNNNNKYEKNKLYLPSLLCDTNTIPYIVIGDGAAAHYSAFAIQKNDTNSKILMVCTRKYIPSNLFTRNKNAFFYDEINESLQLESKEIFNRFTYPPLDYSVNFDRFFSDNEMKISYFVNSDVKEIDTNENLIKLDNDDILYYNKLIIATERKYIKHPILNKISSPNIIHMNNIENYVELIEFLKKDIKNITIIGNTCDAFALSYALSKFENKYNMNHIIEGKIFEFLPEKHKELINDYLKKNDINIIKNQITNINTNDTQLCINLNNNENINTDLIVVFNDITFDTDFLSGNKCKGSNCPDINPLNLQGYTVDNKMNIKSSNLYAAGENVIIKNKTNDTFNHLVGFDQAFLSAKCAGRNSTGLSSDYDYLPFQNFNISNKLRFSVIGNVSNDLETTSYWKKYDKKPELLSNGSGVIFYSKEDKIVGIVLWNTINKLDIAEEIIIKSLPISDSFEASKYILGSSPKKLPATLRTN